MKMNKLTPLQQLQLKIYTTLPDLKELGVGCEIIGWKSRAKYIVLSKINDETYRCLNNKNEIDIIIISQCEILGKPIALTDVLRYVRKLMLVAYKAVIVKIVELWNLSENLLENQSIELVEFLNNL